MTEEQIEQELRLASQVAELIDTPARAEALGKTFLTYARPDAAQRLAIILLDKAAV